MNRAFGLVALVAVTLPARASWWHEPEFGMQYAMATYGNTASARNVIRREAPSFGSDGAEILTLNQDPDQWKAPAQFVFIVRYDILPRYLTAEANYILDGGMGVESSQLDGTSLYLNGTAIQNGKQAKFADEFKIATHSYGLALIGKYPVWRGLGLTGRFGMQHVRTEVSSIFAFDPHTCTGAGYTIPSICGTPWTRGNARNVPTMGVGLEYHSDYFGTVTCEYQRSNIGDAQTGRYTLGSLNFGISFLMSTMH